MTFDAGRIRHDDGLMHYARASNGTAIPSNWIRSTDGTTAATWRPESASAVSYGSNSNDVTFADAAGASSLASRADHAHRGVTSLAHSSNTYTGPITLETEGSLYIVRSAANTYRLGSTGSTGGGSSALTVEEVDGSPTDSAVTKIVFPNSTLSITSHVATYTPTGGGSGNLTAPSAVSVDLGASSLLTRRAATNTEDDLFDASSLNVKWLAYTGADATCDLTALPGWAKITVGGAKLQAVPAGDWTIELEIMWPTLSAAAFQDSGLVVTDGTTRASANEMRFGIGSNNSLQSYRLVHEKFVNGAFNSTYGGGYSFTTPIGGPSLHLRLVKSGTNYTAEFSFVGSLGGPEVMNWQQWQAASAAGFTATHFGFFCAETPTYINGFYRY